MSKPGVLTTAVIVSVCSFSFAWELYELPDASQRLGKLEDRGVGFRTRPLPFTETEAKHLGQANAIKKLCRVNGQAFVMVVIDGTHNRHAVHDPMFCFLGQGWSVQCSRTKVVERGEVQYARLSKEQDVAEVVFWFGDGKERYTSPTQYWLDTTLRRVTFGNSGAEPVLVMLQPIGDKVILWDRVFESPMLQPL